MSDVLTVDNVSVRRGTNFLLRDFSLTVSEGQHWVVLGPNGAGKTTLLELAAGRMHPTTGKVGILEDASAGSTSSNCGRASATPRPPWPVGSRTRRPPSTPCSPPPTA